MNIKLLKLSFLLIFTSIFIFVSCVEEPFIEPVKTPYSLIRVGNFTNQASLKVTVISNKDSKTTVTKNIAQNSFTNYFKVTSGNRAFTVLADNGDTLFAKPISIISYEQETIVFAGYYDGSVNDVNFKNYRDSKVYLPDNTPPKDSAFVRFIDLISPSPTDSVGSELTFSLNLIPDPNKPDSTVEVYNTGELKAYERQGAVVEQGNYNVVGVNAMDTVTVQLMLDAGKNYYIISDGGPENFAFTTDAQDPLPPQSK